MTATTPRTPEPDAGGPRMVSRFEASLLRILRFFMRQVPPEQAMPLVNAKPGRPNCLSATSVHLVCDTLAKGCVLFLVRAGAWRRDRYLRKGKPAFGRLWDRSKVDDLALSFSRQALEFLVWITANKPAEAKNLFQTPVGELTPADQLLLFLAYEALRSDQEVGPALRELPAFAQHALCWLAYPDDFAAAKPPPVPSFEKWVTPPGSYVLEAMEPHLLSRWLHIERGKGQVGDWAKLLQQGQNELRVLDAFAQAAEKAGRHDLARFVLQVLSQVLATPEMAPTFWTGGLQGSGPPRLADRLETQRAALAVLRFAANHFPRWHNWAATRGYLDEDYAAAKFWLAEWERWNGNQVLERAERVAQQLEPLRVSP